MISFTKSFQTSDGNVFGTLALAQEHELETILREVPAYDIAAEPDGTTKIVDIAKHLIKHADKIVDVLTTKKTSRPAGRSINGNKRPRKPKLENITGEPA